MLQKTRLVRLLVLCLSLAFTSAVWAQDERPAYGIRISGFVKNDFILDSRQTVSARDGHFLLYPAEVRYDADGTDINARGSFNYLSIQSRLTGTITGPDAWGAKTSGLIEGAFFGQTDANINGFRLRHAFVRLQWAHTQLLLGQYWHLMFVPECFPETVSFNTGVPFQFFSRNPQIRLRYELGPWALTGMAATQLDFANPLGTIAMRNTLLPDLQGELSCRQADRWHAGLIAGYRRLVPSLVTPQGYSTRAAVAGFTGQAYVKWRGQHSTLKLVANYLQDGFDGLSIGGFVVNRVEDPLRGIVSYAPLSTSALWAEWLTNGATLQWGVFAAYERNWGTLSAIEKPELLPQYTRGADIAALYRISPRVVVNRGKTRWACEIEHTAAAYGQGWDKYAIPQDPQWVTNTRVWMAAYYLF